MPKGDSQARQDLIILALFGVGQILILAVVAYLIAHAPSIVVFGLSSTAASLCLLGSSGLLMTWMTSVGMIEAHRRQNVQNDVIGARAQTDELFAMTDMLQSAEGYDDAAAVLQATTQRLLPGFGAMLYIFNNSRDRLDLAGNWNLPAGISMSETLSPSNCWALKRGKFHINDPASRTLCCNHHGSVAGAIEIPMMARGVVYGLLILVVDGDNSFDRLRSVQRMGRALADSMSLALSNIALRDKLRTQSLRDPLTGLYNRRYMEDALERYVNLAERNGSATAVVMLDLDHFKALNDRLGHAKGDAVLRDVAAQLIGGLRTSDVVCRYGGEELLVILPNCNLEEAAARAESLRARIEGLSEPHEAVISASFGVAALPETSGSLADLIPMADNALYAAKQQGRNRVICAPRRAPLQEFPQKIAVNG